MKTCHFIIISITLSGLALTVTQTRAQSIYTPYSFTNFAGQPGSPGSADGLGSAAQFNTPHSVAVDNAGNLYVGDTFNHTIRKLTPDGVVSTIAGTPGTKGYIDGLGNAQPARFTTPIGISVDTNGNLYLGDTGNQLVRKLTSGATVTTLAGQVGVTGSTNGTGSGATFNNPQGTAVDSAGNIYVADNVNRTIRKITPAGLVTTFAGTTGLQGTNDGIGSAARFYQPNGLTIDSADNLYVADTGGHTIRKITPGALVSTLAGTGQKSGTNDGVGADARFFNPQGVAVDGAGNVYVSDSGNQTIRRITPGGEVSTIAGAAGQSGSANGTNSVASFSTPRGITVDSATNIFVADSANSTIRKLVLDGTNCVVTTFAGSTGQNGSADGTGSTARFHFPYGLTVDSGANLYVVDRSNDDIRRITPEGVVTTFAGVAGQPGSVDGTGAAAQFNGPEDLVLDGAGNIYVVEFFNNTIRKIAPVGTNWVVTTVAGCASCGLGTNDGAGSDARFSSPFGLTLDRSGNLYVADSGNFTIRKVTSTATNWVVTTFAGAPRQQGALDGTGTNARFGGPHDLVADANGNLYLSDGSAIRKISSTGVVTTLAGCPPPGCTNALGSADGNGSSARFGLIRGVALDLAGNLIIADSSNDTIRRLTPDGNVTTLAGTPGLMGFSDGTGSNAFFSAPTGVAVDSLGNVYVVDSADSRITKGILAGTVTPPPLQFDTSNGGLTISNNLFQARVNGPSGGNLILETSIDFQSWTPIQTNSFSTGSLLLAIPLSDEPHRFFRVRLAP